MGKLIKKIYVSVIADGFFFVFGLTENPFDHKLKSIRNRTDDEAIASDWGKVGVDFSNAFNKVTSSYEQA